MAWIDWWRIRTNNPLERILREIRRRTRVVGAFADGQSALNLAAARLRYIAGTAWSTKRYLNIELLKDRWGAGNADYIRGRIGRAGAGCHPLDRRPSVAALQQATRTVLVVFVTVIDPVSSGFVDSLARPGGREPPVMHAAAESAFASALPEAGLE
jgi:Transposase, Mutator family